jgi:DNA-binding MarR family transcriptional regulator
MSVDHEAARRQIDEALGSIGRVRIIAELAKRPEKTFTVYAIAAVTGLKRTDVKANLVHLVAISWVKEYKSIQTRYQINLDNGIVKFWVEFLRSSGYL